MEIDGKEFAVLRVYKVKHDTYPEYHDQGAILVDYEGKDYWIPKELMEDWPDVGDSGEIYVEEWFAIDKGMV